MGSLIAIIIIGAIIYFIYNYYQNKKQEEAESKGPVKPYDKNELRIENVEAGGMLQLANVGPEMKDYEVSVIGKHVYRSGGDEWYELEGETSEGKLWIEYEEDDELEIAVALKKPKMEELSVSASDLDKIDELEEGQVEYNGQTFHYDDSNEGMMLKFGDEDQQKPFYYWDFETSDGEHLLSVEKWGKGDHDVTYSVAVEPNQVSVLKLKNSDE